MKLATLRDGSRDGQLVVVSRDLTTAHYATGIAGRLQQALDDWNFMSPQLQDLYDTLNHGKPRHAFPFDPALAAAPLPRAYAFAWGEAYAAHVERLGGTPARKPRLWPGGGTAFGGAQHELTAEQAALGLDFGAQLAVVTGDIRAGAASDKALDGVRLLMLANAVVLRQIEAAEAQAGQAPLHSRPLVAFAPVAVTPDELGEAWSAGRVGLTLQTQWNGRKVGLTDAAAGMGHGFGQLLAAWAGTRHLRAGSVLASGPVAHPDVALGYHSIAEKRALETAADGQPTTGWLMGGDGVRVEMKGRDGQSLFGAIEQDVAAG